MFGVDFFLIYISGLCSHMSAQHLLQCYLHVSIRSEREHGSQTAQELKGSSWHLCFFFEITRTVKLKLQWVLAVDSGWLPISTLAFLQTHATPCTPLSPFSVKPFIFEGSSGLGAEHGNCSPRGAAWSLAAVTFCTKGSPKYTTEKKI